MDTFIIKINTRISTLHQGYLVNQSHTRNLFPRYDLHRVDRSLSNIPQMSHKAPYPSKFWSLGGKPEKSTDIPITAICLFLYICCAATHMTIFQLNRRRGHKFLFNGVLFGTLTIHPIYKPNQLITQASACRA